MNRISLRRVVMLAALVCGVSSVHAQTFTYSSCYPTTGKTYSDVYLEEVVSNSLFQAFVGVSGTVSWDKKCYGPNGATDNINGRIGFAIGDTGSVQTTLDDNMGLQWGMPSFIGGDTGGSQSYAMTLQGDAAGANVTKTLFGANAMIIAYTGTSDRYIHTETKNQDIYVTFRLDLIGDGARLDWLLTNQNAGVVTVGLWFGQWVTLINSETKASLGILPSSGAEYVTAPGYKPLIVNTRFDNATNPTGFPAYINFGMSQQFAYGEQIINSPSSALTGGATDQTQVDQVDIGIDVFLLSDPFTNNVGFPDQFLNDVSFADYTPDPSNKNLTLGGFDGGDTAFIQKWNPVQVQPGATREIVSYYKSTWSTTSFDTPYTVVLDAPNLISTSAGNSAQFDHNPFDLRVYVDNVRGYSTVYQQAALENVVVQLSLPTGMSSVSDSTKNVLTQTINQVNAGSVGFVDFNVQVAPTVSGFQTYTVRITTASGANRTLSGTINVASQPVLQLLTGANLIGVPWAFNSGATFGTILGLTPNVDFTAFKWDSQQNSYLPATTPTRGVGDWIVMTNGSQNYINLLQSPTEPTDLTAGTLQIQVQPGWNLIANPYDYSVPLGQMIGIPSVNPNSTLTWQELVDQGYVSGALAFWPANSPTPQYQYISTFSDYMLPNTGYWLFVNSNQYVTLQYPAVYSPFLPVRSASKTWTQSSNQWRLQLVARNATQADGQNYVGLAASAKAAQTLQIMKPPSVPLKDAIALSVLGTVNGKETRMAQSLAATAGKNQWTVQVNSQKAGPVTVTWPNMSTVPRGMQFSITDTATGATRDMRRASGYTYTSQDRETRSFTIQSQPGAASQAFIGSVVVTRATKSLNGPLAIAYSLGGNATITVRILKSGNEIYVVQQPRAMTAGSNTVTWSLRDAANRAVAPGAYQVEITAESSTGERVRSVTPINVVR